MSIPVRPEGRPGCWWVTDRQALMRWVTARQLRDIHCLIPSDTPLITGSDWGVVAVIRDIENADRIAITTGESQKENWGHALAVILPMTETRPERLHVFDIGPVTEADLEVVDG